MNEATSRHRSRTRRHRRERVAAASATFSPDDAVRTEVLDAVSRLTARQRAIVYLTYWMDQPVVDVARQLDVSTRTVERELTTARTRLEVLLR
jgi:RNA polymerase sigma factor (sigma-70 family)